MAGPLPKKDGKVGLGVRHATCECELAVEIPLGIIALQPLLVTSSFGSKADSERVFSYPLGSQ